MTFPPDSFERLSEDQLNVMVAELGPLPPLMRELQIRGLQARVKGLPRHLGVMLTIPVAETAVISEPAKQIAQLLAQSRLTDSELNDAALCVDSGAMRLWIRAVGHYKQEPTFKAVDAALSEVVLKAWMRQKAASDEGTDLTEEEAQAAAEQDVDSYEETMRLRDFFRDHWGVESAADLRMWVESMEAIYQQHKEEWPSLDLQGYNRMVKRAFAVFTEARRMNSTPMAMAAWRELVKSGRMKLQPLMIFRRPDGVEQFGDGLPVLRDKEGKNPRRPMAGLLGEMVPEGCTPSDVQLKNQARSAWPDEPFPSDWTPRW